MDFFLKKIFKQENYEKCSASKLFCTSLVFSFLLILSAATSSAGPLINNIICPNLTTACPAAVAFNPGCICGNPTGTCYNQFFSDSCGNFAACSGTSLCVSSSLPPPSITPTPSPTPSLTPTPTPSPTPTPTPSPTPTLNPGVLCICLYGAVCGYGTTIVAPVYNCAVSGSTCNPCSGAGACSTVPSTINCPTDCIASTPYTCY